ncbi:DUF551 domain-containing protein [Raoultella planticola]
MTSKLTRERIELIANFHRAMTLPPSHDEIEELARMALAAMDSEPVAWLLSGGGAKNVVCFDSGNAYADPLREVTPLYRHAQPAPVVQCPFPCGWDNLNKLAIQDAALVARGLAEGEPVTEPLRQAAISNNDRLLKVISACRAAMLQAGRSPVIPEGYVLVPKSETLEMAIAGGEVYAQCESVGEHPTDAARKIWREMVEVAMLEAAHQPRNAPQNIPEIIPEIIPGWIPVSERLPEVDGNYWGWWSESKRQGPVWFIKSDLQAQFQSSEITHWMPMPAAPQEANHG